MKVIYHANCHDGSGAALAAWMHCGDTLSTGEAVEYMAAQYGDDPPAVDGEEVFILDFSYPRDVLIKMGVDATRVTVIDHHKTAQADLSEPFPRDIEAGICDIRCIFDMDKSGAVLAWEYFHDAPLPQLFRHIQDRDLWRWELEGTAEIHAGLSLQEDWKQWKRFVDNPDELKTLYTGGAAIKRFLYIQADKITDTPPRQWDIEGDTVPLYNLPGFMLSDTLHLALQKYPDMPYAVGYFDLPDKRVYSLRSRDEASVDVSQIAKKHGGGGHKNAAGFAVDKNMQLANR